METNGITVFFSRFSLLIITLSGNAAFIALLASIPNIPSRYLIIAHVVVMIAKSWYMMDKQAVSVKEIPSKTVEVASNSTIESDLDIWQH